MTRKIAIRLDWKRTLMSRTIRIRDVPVLRNTHVQYMRGIWLKSPDYSRTQHDKCFPTASCWGFWGWVSFLTYTFISHRHASHHSCLPAPRCFSSERALRVHYDTCNLTLCLFPSGLTRRLPTWSPSWLRGIRPWSPAPATWWTAAGRSRPNFATLVVCS